MFQGVDRDRFLAVLAELPAERAEALTTLPQVLVRHGEGYATVSFRHPDNSLTLAGSIDPRIEVGAALPADGIVAMAAREGRVIYLTDASSHPNYRTAGGKGYPVELALPIFEREQVAAVLNIERFEPYSRAERNVLELFTAGVSRQLTQASYSLEARLNATLSKRLATVTSMAEAASIALQVIAPAVGANSGSLLYEHGSALLPIALYGDDSLRDALGDGTPYPQGFAWSASLNDEPQFSRDYRNDPRSLERLRTHVPDVVLTLPIGRTGAMSLHFPDEAHVSAADIELLASVAEYLTMVLEAGHAAALQADLMTLYARALEDGTSDLYQLAVETAVAHAPGAEAGSLIVRRSVGELFRYEGAVGFDLAELRRTTFTEKQMRAWYEAGDEGWRQGRPRVLTSETRDMVDFSRSTSGAEGPAHTGALEGLKSNACVPIAYQGQVLALLNLDNFTRPDAFEGYSLRTLAAIGAPVAAMLAGAHFRDEILRANRTDPLTGLMNRDGFTRLLERQHERSAHTGEPYTVLSMDLTGFKQINDTLGHAAGDAALQSVARSLEAASRPGDSVSRWGGDEFVALLPRTAAQDAEAICHRFERVVGELRTGGLSLGVDIGTATFLSDADTTDELLRIADTRMYANKQEGKRLKGEQGGA